MINNISTKSTYICSFFPTISRINEHELPFYPKYSDIFRTSDISALILSTEFIVFLYLFSNKKLVIRAGNHKIFIKIANREDLDQTAQYDLGLHCFTRPFFLAGNQRSKF